MGIFDTVAATVGAGVGAPHTLGGIGGGGGFFDNLFSADNLLLAGLSGLNVFGQHQAAERNREQFDRGLEFREEQNALDREASREALAQRLFLEQLAMAQAAEKAAMQAELEKQRRIQDAFQRLVSSTLTGATGTTNALTNIAQLGQNALR